jgi:hypothetical protein
MSRPARTRVPKVLNHPGVTKLTAVIRSMPCSGVPPEMLLTGRIEIISTGGVARDTDASATPGSARTASRARS